MYIPVMLTRRSGDTDPPVFEISFHGEAMPV
jgi:hypothetical protein